MSANDRYKLLCTRFGIQSRYAGTICVDNDAAVKAASEHQWQRLLKPRGATALLEQRVALPSKAALCGCKKRRCEQCGRGYSTENERVMKRRRLDVLLAELARVEKLRAGKTVSVVLGGRRLANARHHLDAADLSLEQWQQRWDHQRAWFGCAGNVGKPGGNPCLSLVDRDGGVFLTVSVPKPVQVRFGMGSRVMLTAPVSLSHHGNDLRERFAARQRCGSTSTSGLTGRAGLPCTCGSPGSALSHLVPP